MTVGCPQQGLEAQLEAEVKIEVTEATEVTEVTEVGGPVWRPLRGPLHPIGDEPLKKYWLCCF